VGPELQVATCTLSILAAYQLNRLHAFEDLVANFDKLEGSPIVNPTWNVIVLEHSLAKVVVKALPVKALPRDRQEPNQIDRPFFDRIKALDKATVKRAIGDLPTPMRSTLYSRDATISLRLSRSWWSRKARTRPLRLSSRSRHRKNRPGRPNIWNSLRLDRRFEALGNLRQSSVLRQVHRLDAVAFEESCAVCFPGGGKSVSIRRRN
jgi:hypothetical protein